MPLLEIINLTKRFNRPFQSVKDQIIAVDNLNLNIDKGEIFAFLGPNGAGKTTTLNMLVGFLRPTSGTIKLFGNAFTDKSIDVKKHIGYFPESVYLPHYYRVGELLDFYCDIFFIPKKQRKDIINKILQDVGLHNQYKKWIKNLSTGQKRCLGLASALVNDPDLLLLDEPTVYLDPLILENIREALLELKNQGKTIFLSSHILSEVEKLADRFAIIKEGKLIDQGTTKELIKHQSLEDKFLEVIKRK